MIKELLERWSQLEPHLCKQETRPNKDWYEEFEDYYAKLNNKWQIIYHDGAYSWIQEEAPMRIQYAIQQAIIEKGWYLEIMLFSDNAGSFIKVGKGGEHNQGIRFPHSNLAEALLTTYLKVLDA